MVSSGGQWSGCLASSWRVLGLNPNVQSIPVSFLFKDVKTSLSDPLGNLGDIEGTNEGCLKSHVYMMIGCMIRKDLHSVLTNQIIPDHFGGSVLK